VDAVTLLRRARNAGLRVKPVGDQLLSGDQGVPNRS
jgi:hypothetical protein